MKNFIGVVVETFQKIKAIASFKEENIAFYESLILKLDILLENMYSKICWQVIYYTTDLIWV